MRKDFTKLNLFENIFKNMGNQFTNLNLLYFVFRGRFVRRKQTDVISC